MSKQNSLGCAGAIVLIVGLLIVAGLAIWWRPLGHLGFLIKFALSVICLFAIVWLASRLAGLLPADEASYRDGGLNSW
jgi:hypothetical protein